MWYRRMQFGGDHLHRHAILSMVPREALIQPPIAERIAILHPCEFRAERIGNFEIASLTEH